MSAVAGFPKGPTKRPLYLICHDLDEVPEVLARYFNLPCVEDDLIADQEYAFFKFGAVNLMSTMVLKGQNRRDCADVFQVEVAKLDLDAMEAANEFDYIFAGVLYQAEKATFSLTDMLKSCLPKTPVILVEYFTAKGSAADYDGDHDFNHRHFMRTYDRPRRDYELKRGIKPHATE